MVKQRISSKLIANLFESINFKRKKIDYKDYVTGLDIKLGRRLNLMSKCLVKAELTAKTGKLKSTRNAR